MDNWSADREFLQTFRVEAEERLHNLAEGLMMLEHTPGDEELLKKLFREAHTLKGAAGMMGFDTVRDLSHRVEDLLSSVQKGQLTLNKNRADIILETLDRIEELLPDSDTCQVPEMNVSGLMERLTRANQSKGAADSTQEREDGMQTASPVDLSAVSPSNEPEDPHQPAAATKNAGNSLATKTPAVAEASPRVADPTIRVNIEKLDKLLNLMGEMLVNQINSEGQVHELSDLQQAARDLRHLFSSLTIQAEGLKNDSGADQIASFSEKLIQAEHRVEAIGGSIDTAASHYKENTASRRLALDELQDRTMEVRMLPMANVFSLFPRIVRDASSSSGKIVQLRASGEETEIDKRMLEQISDPLMHIIRNCVDHGIENPAERVAAGKPEMGTIRIEANQRGNRVEIDIRDDGAGIDPEKVRNTAVEKGLLEAGNELSDEDLIELIFRPGFSTAQAITEISGRGVGLDVVKSNIENLEGFVSVESEPGIGTRFTISLPVTLAVIKGLLVEANDFRFVIPLSLVKEMVALQAGDISTLGSHRSFQIRDAAIPMIDLIEYLGGGHTERVSGRSQVVVVGSDKFLLGLEVGRLLGEQEVVIKQLGPFLGSLPFVAGFTILGSGEAVVVLNISRLARTVKEGTPGRQTVKPQKTSAIPEVRRKNVLVVEDSLVVRELQRNILETAGYEVDTAVDGADALKQLAQKPADCVVTDIEMPRMDGFDLTSAIRKTEDLKYLPVIMVTSRSNDSDKKRGIEVGADAYVIKGNFDQDILLSTIERLVA